MTTETITESAAARLFASIAGTSFIGLTAITCPDTRGGKSVTPYYRKRTVCTVFAGETPSYEKMVDKRARAAYVEAVGERPAATEVFRAGALWRGNGRHVAGAVVEHIPTGKLYLFAYFMKNSKPDVTYYHAESVEVEGQKVWHQVDKDTVPLAPRKKDVVYVTVDGVEVEAEIVVRCYAIESIHSFRIDGMEYVVNHDAPATLLQVPAVAARAEIEVEAEVEAEADMGCNFL
jgi:hypothetical protein